MSDQRTTKRESDQEFIVGLWYQFSTAGSTDTFRSVLKRKIRFGTVRYKEECM